MRVAVNRARQRRSRAWSAKSRSGTAAAGCVGGRAVLGGGLDVLIAVDPAGLPAARTTGTAITAATGVGVASTDSCGAGRSGGTSRPSVVGGGDPMTSIEFRSMDRPDETATP